MVQPGMLPEPIVQRKVIVVEGPDDRRFLGALSRHLGIEPGVQVIEAQGKDNLRQVLRALTLASGFAHVETLAVIRDADNDPRAAFQSLCNSLLQAGLIAPPRLNLVVPGNPAVGIFVWPDCHSPGQLETLCLEAVSSEPAMDCVNSYLDCLQHTQESLPQPADKARLQVFLASRNRPGLRLGEAAEAGYFSWDQPVFEPIKHFLQSL